VVKRLRILDAPSSARKHARQSQECMMPRSFRRPVPRKERRGRHSANRRGERLRINICRRAFEARLEPDRLATLVDAWWDHSLQADRAILRIPMKKIAHSELMTIRSSPSDAVKNIVEQVIVMVKN
jgi:hypothetical protein